MRKFAIIVALASTALATSAFARNDAWYIGVEGGPSIVEDISLDIGALNNAGTVDHKTGYDVDGIIGYDFGGFRLESEVGYKTAGVNNYSSTTTTAATTTTGGTGNFAAGSYPLAG